MKINRIEIANFGKFSDYIIDLSDSFQVIYGNNEDGKSTLMAFIEMMFYGDQGRARAIDKNSRLKYAPWNGSPMEGALVFMHDDTEYRLQKLFGATFGRDKVDLINLKNNSSVQLKQGEEVGTHFFGLDLEGFRRSSFIGQVGRIEVGTGTDMVAEKLISNVAQTGDENFSHQEVITRLDEAMVDMQAKRGAKGIMLEAKNDLQSLIDEKEQVKHQIELQQDITSEYHELEELQKQKENIEKTLLIYNCESRRSQLDDLLKASTEFDELVHDITNESYSYEKIQPLLDEGATIMENQNQVLQGLKPMEESMASLGLSPITGEDFSSFQTMLKLKSQAEELSEFYDNLVAPALQESLRADASYGEINSEYKEQSLAIQKLEPNQYKLEKLEARQKEIEKLLGAAENRVESKAELWEEQRSLEKERLDFAKSKLDDIALINKSSSRPNLVFLILGIIIALASGASGYFINIYLFAGVAIGLLFIILAFVNKGSGKEKRELEDVTLEYERAKAKYDLFEKDISEQRLNLKKELEFLTDEYNQNKRELDEFSELLSKFSNIQEVIKNLKLELQHAAIEKESSLTKLENVKASFLEKIEKTDSSFSQLVTNGTFDFEYIEINLSNIISTSTANIENVLSDKKAGSTEEFQQKHLDYQSNEKNRKAVERLDSKLKEIELGFVEKINKYKPASNFADAYNVFLDLREKFNKTQDIKNYLTITANALGINDYSKETLEKALSEIPTENSALSRDEAERLEEQLKGFNGAAITERIKELAGQMRPPERSVEQIDSEIHDLTEQVEDMEQYYTSLSTALKVMENAQEEMRQSFGPILDQKTSEIFSEITDGKYDDVVINKNYEIKVKSGVHLRESPYLSSGTIDQAYLALRLAISELISQTEGSLPLFLDDVLIQYDDERSHLAMKFLTEYSKDHNLQIILFSCHSRTVELAKEFGIATSTIL